MKAQTDRHKTDVDLETDCMQTIIKDNLANCETTKRENMLTLIQTETCKAM